MLFIKCYGNSPFERSPRNAQILEARQQEVVHHLVLARYRLNEFRMCVDILDQSVGVFAHFEEICFFLRGLDFSSAVGTLAVDKL